MICQQNRDAQKEHDVQYSTRRALVKASFTWSFAKEGTFRLTKRRRLRVATWNCVVCLKQRDARWLYSVGGKWHLLYPTAETSVLMCKRVDCRVIISLSSTGELFVKCLTFEIITGSLFTFLHLFHFFLFLCSPPYMKVADLIPTRNNCKPR